MPIDSFLKIISLFREGEQIKDQKAVTGGVKPDDKIPVTTSKPRKMTGNQSFMKLPC